MSERSTGNPFENLGATDVTIEREQPKKDEVVIPQRIKKQRRTPTSIPPKKRQTKQVKSSKKEEPINPYGYSEDDLANHLVEDTPELEKVGNWLDEELDKHPKPEGVIEVVGMDDYLYEKQSREQDEITEKRIAEEESFERKVAEKLDSLDENSELINDPRTQQSIADRVRSSIPKITPEQFQEGIKWKNIPNYEPGKIPESEVTIEKNRRKPKKPLKIIDSEFSESDLVSNKSEDVVKNEIVQVEKKPEKKRRLKSAVETVMEKTQTIADEYNEKKLKKEDIDNVQTIDELLSVIDKTEGIQGSQEYFDKDKLKMIIEMVRDGELGFEYITRSGGLRQRVFDILNNNKEISAEIELSNEPAPSLEISAEEIEDEEQITPLPEDRLSDKVLSFNEKNLATARSDYLSAWKKYQKEFEDFNKVTNPFKRFWMKITSADEKLNRAQEYSEQIKKEYYQKIDALIEEKTNLKIKEILSLRANSPDRRKYERVRVGDLESFLARFGRSLPESFIGVDKNTLINASDEIDKGVLNKKEADALREEVIKLEIRDEISKQMYKDETELLDRKIIS